MNTREKKIIDYFDSWVNNDSSKFDDFFSDDIIYNECYGPIYNGLGQVKKWFSSWNTHASMLKWEVKQFIHGDRITVVEWYLSCRCDGLLSEFDGVSLIEFNEKDQFVYVREFQAKAEHNKPWP